MILDGRNADIQPLRDLSVRQPLEMAHTEYFAAFRRERFDDCVEFVGDLPCVKIPDNFVFVGVVIGAELLFDLQFCLRPVGRGIVFRP